MEKTKILETIAMNPELIFIKDINILKEFIKSDIFVHHYQSIKTLYKLNKIYRNSIKNILFEEAKLIIDKININENDKTANYKLYTILYITEDMDVIGNINLFKMIECNFSKIKGSNSFSINGLTNNIIDVFLDNGILKDGKDALSFIEYLLESKNKNIYSILASELEDVYIIYRKIYDGMYLNKDYNKINNIVINFIKKLDSKEIADLCMNNYFFIHLDLTKMNEYKKSLSSFKDGILKMYYNKIAGSKLVFYNNENLIKDIFSSYTPSDSGIIDELYSLKPHKDLVSLIYNSNFLESKEFKKFLVENSFL